MLARSGLPGERPGGPMPAHAGKATKTTPPTAVAPTAEASSATADARPVVRVSQPTATFMARHPVWVDGAGNEITVPAYAVDGAVAAGAENRPPPRPRRSAPRDAPRRRRRARTSSGRRSTRGSCGSRGAVGVRRRAGVRRGQARRGEELLGGELEAPPQEDRHGDLRRGGGERAARREGRRAGGGDAEGGEELLVRRVGESAKSTEGPAPAPARAEAPEAPPEAPPASDTAAQ